MYVPDILLNDKSNLKYFWPEAQCDRNNARTWLHKTISDAWRKLVVSKAKIVERIDVVIDGPISQITPLVTCDGVVIRLDLGGNHCYPELEDERRNIVLDQLQSLIYHEIFHVADRLDPKFAMDYHEDAVVASEKMRREVNAVWDVYIEKRKLREYHIQPIACYWLNISDAREAVLRNFINLDGDDETIQNIFGKIWDINNLLTYKDITDYANEILDSVTSYDDSVEFINSPRHLLLATKSPKSRDAVQWLIHMLPVELRRKIINWDPPLLFIASIGGAFKKTVRERLPHGLHIIGIPKELELCAEVTMEELAAVVGHEIAHIVLGQSGKQTEDQEYEADAKVVEWQLGEFLLKEYERELMNPKNYGLDKERINHMKKRVDNLRELLG